MGKSSKPLIIACDEELLPLEPLQALAAQGHQLGNLSLAPEADVILSKKAWRMFDTTLKYLPLMIKASRLVKYPKKKGEQDAD